MGEQENREKRRKVRIPFIYGIEFDDAEDGVILSADPKTPAPATNVVLKDISADGIQIACPRLVTEGSQVRLLIRFPRRRDQPRDELMDETECMVMAKVRWVAKNQAEKGFRVGLLFVSPDTRAREMIDRYLDENIVVEDDETL